MVYQESSIVYRLQVQGVLVRGTLLEKFEVQVNRANTRKQATL
jgi:hypothetical protein